MSLAEPPGLQEFRARRRATFYAKTDLPFSQAELREVLRLKRERAEEFRPKIVEAAEYYLGKKPVSVLFLPDAGTFHSLYRVELEQERWYFRADVLGLFGPACELLIDEQVTRLVQSRDIPAPVVVKADVTRTHLPFDFEILQEARGQSLKSVEDPETQHVPEAILRDLGRSLAKVHSIHVRGFGLLDAYPPIFGVLESWPDYLRLHLDNHLEICEELKAISPRERRMIDSLLLEAEPLFKSAPCQLLHGDPGHHNVFVEEEKVSCLIDWEDAMGGDPVFDLAFWGTFTREEFREPLLAGYTEVRTLPEDFERRYWLYYLRISLSKTVHRFLFNYKERPGRPAASQRIQKALERLGAF
jgi:aminoglycoside phosphotransferase (APT) family kinase protein